MFLFFVLARDLRAPSADCSETLPHDRKLQNLGTLPPEKIWELKHAKFGAILDSFRLWSRIYLEQIKILKIRNTWSMTILPAFGERSLVNFGPLTIKLERWTLTHTRSTSSEDHTLAPRECCSLKFLHMLENGHGLLTHTPTGSKFSVCTPITLALGGVTSQNFFKWRAMRQVWQFRYSFWGPAPVKFERAKIRHKFVSILDNFRLWSPLSPEGIEISEIGKASDQL